MRTTLTIAGDILRHVRGWAHRTSRSLTGVANETQRAGLDRSCRRRRYREAVADLGQPRVDLDHALAITAQFEDRETLRKVGGPIAPTTLGDWVDQ